MLAADGVLQLAHRLGFDLADSLPRDLEDPPHLFQGVGVAVPQTISQANNLAFAIGERLEKAFDLFTQDAIVGVPDRIVAVRILDELSETAIIAFADGSVQASLV